MPFPWGRLSGVCCSMLFLGSLHAAGPSLTLQVSDEIAPPGAAVQIKISLARPRSVTSAVVTADLDPAFFGDAAAASAFSASGDAYGWVVLNGRHVEVHIFSDTAGIGVVNGLPVATITATILPSVAVGTKTPVTVSSGDTTASGSVTAGGAVSISRVEAAGQLVHIFGAGFTASSAVEIAGVVVASAQTAGPQQIDVMLAAPAEFTGRRVRVDGVDFFPALLADPVTTSSRDPMAGARPILPLQSSQSAETADLARRTGWVVVRNPNPVAVDAAVQMVIIDQVLSESLVTIAAGASATVPFSVSGGGGRARVLASAPVRSVAVWKWIDLFSNLISTGASAPGYSAATPATLWASPDPITFVWTPGSPKPPAQTVNIGVTSSQQVTVAITASTESGGNWLSVTPPSQVLNGGRPNMEVTADPGTLSPGIYRGTITLTATPMPFRTIQPHTVAVVLTVGAPKPQTVASCCYEFTTPSGIAQSYSFNIPADVISGAFSSTAATDGGGDWLAFSPTTGTAPTQVNVSLKPNSVPPGNYSGEVLILGSAGGTVYVPVTYRVYGGVQLYTADYYLLFQAKPGDSLLPALTTAITARCAEVGCAAGTDPVAIPWTAFVKTNSGGTWLSASATPAGLRVSANAAGLTPGVYTGVVTLASEGASGPTQVPVVLLVAPSADLPALAAEPSSLLFSSPSALYSQSTCVLAGKMQPQLAITTDAAWLKAVTSGVSEFPCVVNVSVDTTGLAPGTYFGKVTASAGGQSVVIPVTLAIPADGAPPAVSSVVNAASVIEESAASGELITIYGDFNPRCGYCEPAINAGPITVSVDGVAVPILAGTASSVTVELPRALAGKSAATLQVSYGSYSTLRGIPLADAAPGIFTLDGSGQGQAAVLNQGEGLNFAARPAARGSVIQVFATGMGAGPVRVMIGGVDASVLYVGADLASVIVPPAAPAGASVPIAIAVGAHRSQDGVTIAVI